MRLTLRTMLAFMDGILEPEDAQDIGKKVDESQYATGLMHRIRDVMRRLRLAAPGLSDRGPNLDPNTVAEYLDNTLSDDRVPDFEKVCLESDIHLAEVASCHQILTLVLGEPAEVDPASRQRMYQIPQVLAAQMGANERITVAPQLEERAPVIQIDTTPKPSPAAASEQLQPSRRNRRLVPALFGTALLAGFLVVVLFALGQFEPNTPLGRLLGMRETATSGDKPADVTTPGPTDTVATPPKVDLPDESVSPSAPDSQPLDQPTPGSPDDVTTRLPEVTNPLEPNTTTPDNNPPNGAVPNGVVPPPDAGNEPIPPNPLSEKPQVVPADGAVGDLVPADKPAVDTPPANPAEVVENATPIGRLISDKQLLLAYDPKLDGYVRVAHKAIFLPGTRLLVLPTYQPEIGLSMGVHLRLLGGTEATLVGPDAQTQGGVNLFYGRIVLMPLAGPGAKLRLTVGNRTGILTLAQAESVAALEVAVTHVPGSNPEETPAKVVSTLYVSSGNVLWDDGLGGATVSMAGGQQMVLDAQSPSPPVTAAELPKWIRGETLGLLDARASAMIEQAITPEKLAQTTLLELNDHRQKELRWLSARSLAYMDRFETLVAGLNQPDLKAEWQEYMSKLTDALALGPEAAIAIREEFCKKYGPEGVDAYRMLWGYTDESLQNGGAAQLVKYLDHETLAFRVLAYLNLKDIRGAGLLYRPEQTAILRKQPTQRWKDLLASGEIRLRGAGEAPEKGVSSGAASDSIGEEPK